MVCVERSNYEPVLVDKEKHNSFRSIVKKN